MRDMFAHRYLPTADEFTRLWQRGAVVMDANVLLGLYGYTADTRATLFSVLAGFKDRLWLPYQVALEYHNNRVSTMNKHRQALLALPALLNKAIDDWTKEHGRNGTFDLEAIRAAIAALKTTADSYKLDFHDDPIRAELDKLFEGRVGTPPTKDTLDDWHSTARTRYASKQPPGFEDAKKPIPEVYGDAVLWLEMRERAKSSGLDILFVTDDRKRDWWELVDGRVVGPHPSLRQEMREYANQLYYSYSSEQFLLHAGQHLKIETAAVREEARKAARPHSQYTFDSLALLTSLREQLDEHRQAPASALDALRSRTMHAFLRGANRGMLGTPDTTHIRSPQDHTLPSAPELPSSTHTSDGLPQVGDVVVRQQLAGRNDVFIVLADGAFGLIQADADFAQAVNAAWRNVRVGGRIWREYGDALGLFEPWVTR